MNTLLAIFIGGGFGSVTRFGISSIVTSNFKQINPIGTLTSNMISTFSTFSYETFELLRTENYLFAVANLLISIFLGVGVLFILARSI